MCLASSVLPRPCRAQRLIIRSQDLTLNGIRTPVLSSVDGAGVVVVEQQVDRIARRDVIIHHEPESWSVEAREGGEEGRSRRFPASDEGEADNTAEKLFSTDERWREMT